MSVFFAEVGDLVDAFFFGIDFGTQNGLLCGTAQSSLSTTDATFFALRASQGKWEPQKGMNMTTDQHDARQRFAANYDENTHLLRNTGESALYAALLLERPEETDLQRATDMIAALMKLQVDDPASRVHGQFFMVAGAETGDLNSILFLMPTLIRILELGRDHLPEPIQSEFDGCMQRAVMAVERRWDEERFDLYRDFKAYTNVFLLYIQALVLIAKHFGSARHARMATAQWQRWFNHISYYGIDELSPAYSDVDYEALETICAQSPDNQTRREAAWVLAYLSAIYHAITHPILQLPVCGSFRNYRRFLTQVDCEPNCVRQGGSRTHVSDDVRQDYEARQYPYAVRGRATAMPFWFRSWQEQHAAMGTMTGGNYFWQQIHCMVAVGNSATERAVMFMPGAFTPTSGFTAQQEMTALCVFSREPNTLHRTQYPMPDADVHAYQQDFEIGITDNWQVTERDAHTLVLSAYGYDVHIRPFAIQGETLHPLMLERASRHSMGQRGFHDPAAEFDVFRFPAEVVRFGCLVQVCKAGEPPPASTLACSQRREYLTVAVDTPQLAIKLFRQPSGDLTECYDADWRIAPLFESPAFTLHPGALTQRAANTSTRKA